VSRPARGVSPATARRRLLRRLVDGDRPFYLAFVVLLALLAAMTVGPLQSYTAAADRVDLLTATRDKLESEVERLETQRDRLHDPEMIELIVREELGMMKPGEIPFVVATKEQEIGQLGPDTGEAPPPDETWWRRLGRWLAGLAD
jgi:cell division protein FtsB